MPGAKERSALPTKFRTCPVRNGGFSLGGALFGKPLRHHSALLELRRERLSEKLLFHNTIVLFRDPLHHGPTCGLPFLPTIFDFRREGSSYVVSARLR